uniref:NET domain-containing protein n=1 Tax=Oryza glaberrima TaxID=4538 RepID=I1P202_ORYGL
MEEIIGRSSPRGHGGSGSLLRKRCRSEMEAVRGLLKKAEALVRKAAAGAAARRPLPRRVKDKEAMTMAQKEQLVGLLSSLPAGILPSHVADFMRRRCSWRAVPGVDGDDDELEIDLGSTEDAALFELRKMLDDEAAVRRTSPRGLEDGEVADEYMDICGGVSPLPAAARKPPPLALSSPPAAAEQEDDLIDIFVAATLLYRRTRISSTRRRSSSQKPTSSSTSTATQSTSRQEILTQPPPVRAAATPPDHQAHPPPLQAATPTPTAAASATPRAATQTQQTISPSSSSNLWPPNHWSRSRRRSPNKLTRWGRS